MHVASSLAYDVHTLLQSAANLRPDWVQQVMHCQLVNATMLQMRTQAVSCSQTADLALGGDLVGGPLSGEHCGAQCTAGGSPGAADSVLCRLSPQPFALQQHSAYCIGFGA